MTPQPQTPPRELTPTIRILEKLLHFYVDAYHSVTQTGACRLPAEGPAIIVSNHISSLDPVIIQSCCGRLIHWLMAREYYTILGLKWLLDAIGAIPVRRNEHDFAATRAALRVLKRGGVVGVFPEGRIGDARTQEFHPGAGLLACNSGAPVFPVHLEGTTRGSDMVRAFIYPQRVAVSFGEPFKVAQSAPSRQALARTAIRMKEAVTALGR